QAANYLIGGVVPKAKGSAHPNIAPYQAFRASDGWFVMAAATDKQYRSACDVVGRPELRDDPRFVTNSDRVVNREQLVDELNQVFGTQPVTHWVEVLNAAGIPTGPVRMIDEVFESEEGRSVLDVILDPVRGGIPMVRSPIRLDGSSRPPTPPPALGEHTEEIKHWVAAAPPRHGG
ncbi:MAG TPA: CoA transferase, partial [Acidimicrobiia bacterium]|nr:CoA transferase [Acidimicrobiia bacterium]